MLCDSNILIYAVDPADSICRKLINRPEMCISVVTRIEALGFPRFHLLEAEIQRELERTVRGLPELPLNDDIVDLAIQVRRKRSIRLGDSIIAATALHYSLPLLTRNVADFIRIEGLSVVNPFDLA